MSINRKVTKLIRKEKLKLYLEWSFFLFFGTAGRVSTKMFAHHSNTFRILILSVNLSRSMLKKDKFCLDKLLNWYIFKFV